MNPQGLGFNVNLHPSFFQQQLPPQPERRTIDSVEFSRSLPIDLKIAPRKNYSLYSETEAADSYAKEALRGIHTVSELSNLYFSRKNVNELRNLIRYFTFINSGGVFDNQGIPIKDTGHIVGKQSETELIILMRYIYLQNSGFPTNCSMDIIQREIDRLNKLVIEQAVPRIIQEAEGHLGYIRDASRLPTPIPRALATSNKGLKILRSTTEVLGGEF